MSPPRWECEGGKVRTEGRKPGGRNAALWMRGVLKRGVACGKNLRALVKAQGDEISRLEGRLIRAEAKVSGVHDGYASLRADLFAALNTQRGRIDSVAVAVERIERKVDDVLRGIALLRNVAT